MPFSGSRMHWGIAWLSAAGMPLCSRVT
uniref:Uncharacterized protein n=1 Tax=Rhizophora mucronata TaxID=61149 RepID=A0A2P2PR69_RHIMU